MSLDYTEGCVNFRDVGEFINLILGEETFLKGKLLRGGSIDYIKSLAEIGHPKSVFNLRNGNDSDLDKVDYYHFPMLNKIEKYDTSQKEVKVWLNEILSQFESDEFRYPVFIHCLSGKDRTGIVVATILLILDIDIETIKEEYLLSDGEVKKELIEMSLNGIKDIETYFNRIDLNKIRENLNKNMLFS